MSIDTVSVLIEAHGFSSALQIKSVYKEKVMNGRTFEVLKERHWLSKKYVFQHENNDGESKASNNLNKVLLDDDGIWIKKISYKSQMKSLIEFVIDALFRYTNDRYDIGNEEYI